MSLLMDRLQSVHTALESAEVDHAVGGAIALAIHVREPRFTADIDLNVMANAQAPESLLAALPHEVTVTSGAAQEIKDSGQVRLYFEDMEPHTPLDLFLPVHATYHRLVVDRAVAVEMLHGVKVMTATDLMVFKSLFARSKDWVDVETLGENHAGDLEEAARWVWEITEDQAKVSRLRQAWNTGAGSTQPE